VEGFFLQCIKLRSLFFCSFGRITPKSLYKHGFQAEQQPPPPAQDSSFSPLSDVPVFVLVLPTGNLVLPLSLNFFSTVSFVTVSLSFSRKPPSPGLHYLLVRPGSLLESKHSDTRLDVVTEDDGRLWSSLSYFPPYEFLGSPLATLKTWIRTSDASSGPSKFPSPNLRPPLRYAHAQRHGTSVNLSWCTSLGLAPCRSIRRRSF